MYVIFPFSLFPMSHHANTLKGGLDKTRSLPTWSLEVGATPKENIDLAVKVAQESAQAILTTRELKCTAARVLHLLLFFIASRGPRETDVSRTFRDRDFLTLSVSTRRKK